MEVLEPCGLKLGLKWPNDLVAWRAQRLVKLGGIIGEQKGDRVILGLGLNLRAAPELPDRPIPPACLLALGARELPDALTLARSILDAWQDLSLLREPGFWWPIQGDAIQWEDGRGICEGWLPDGQLAVNTDEGPRTLCAGDVSGLSATCKDGFNSP
jgi:BirA family biotin operon repressor/biotin-[acetyl-CoA-carboxylase] ligase